MQCDVAILAGGLGTRLRPAVGQLPKVLASVGGRPFLFRILDQLVEAGCERAVLCTGFEAAQVSDALGERYRNMRVVYSVETSPLGTGGALKNAEGYLRSDLVLVMNGDSFVDTRLDEFVEWHTGHRSQASMLTTRVEDAARYGTVELDAQGQISAFSEKRGISEPGWVNAGIYLLPRKWIEEIPANQSASLERDLLPMWLHRGIMAHGVRSPFIDIGLPETWAAAGEFFAEIGQEHG